MRECVCLFNFIFKTKKIIIISHTGKGRHSIWRFLINFFFFLKKILE